MLTISAPANGGAPIAPDACMICVAEAASWTMCYSRPATLCGTHYLEWAAEKD